jgi:hypothetical protein
MAYEPTIPVSEACFDAMLAAKMLALRSSNVAPPTLADWRLMQIIVGQLAGAAAIMAGQIQSQGIDLQTPNLLRDPSQVTPFEQAQMDALR